MPHPPLCTQCLMRRAASYQAYKPHSFRRADNAFSPHPPFCAQCLMRRGRVLSCLQNHTAHFNNLSFIPYSSTSAIIDFQLNHHLMNKNND
ncbi:hypothetical protein CRI63_17760 [Escherichia sp. E2661]|nr:hypothetical protein CRI63_17760 [Escherichia sp. E2661]